MSEYVDTTALLEVLLTSLVGGAGLVTMFAVGLLGLSRYRPATGDAGEAAGVRGSVAGLVLAVTCFAVVLVGVGLGLYVMLAKD